MKCDCINIGHSSKACRVTATRICQTCRAQLCSPCTRNHHSLGHKVDKMPGVV